MVPGYNGNLSPKLAETSDLIILEATIQSRDPRGTPGIEDPRSLRSEEQQLAAAISKCNTCPRQTPALKSLSLPQLWPETCPILSLCTLIETSGARGLALGSTNGRAEGSVPFWTSFPKRDPCSRNFLVSSRVSTPVKTAQPQMMVPNSVISEGRCPGVPLLLGPDQVQLFYRHQNSGEFSLMKGHCHEVILP